MSSSVMPPLFDQVLMHEATHAVMEEAGLNARIDSVTMQELLAWFMETHAIEVIDAVSSSLGRPVCVSGICR